MSLNPYSIKATRLQHAALLRELDYAKCEQSLAHFVKASWRILEPTNELAWNWHLSLLTEYLEQVADGKIQRLLINIPPRSLKSTIVTICYPVWRWIKDPSRRFMFASYAQALSTEHSVARRRLVESDWFQARWETPILDDQNTKHHFKTTERGQMFATSTGGSATGIGCDELIIDDPHSAQDALSEATRKAQIDAIDKGLMTRFNNPKTGAAVVVMQRLHEEDYSGHLLAKGSWVHLKLPTIASENEKIAFPRSLISIDRHIGDLLHPARIDDAEVIRLKRELGSFGFAGQHQQEPAPLEGGILKVANWMRYTPDEIPERFDQIVQSWDMRFKRTTSEQSKNKGDYVVGVVLGMVGPKVYLLDLVRGLWGFKDSRDEVVKLSAKWPKAVAKYVENKANGPGIVDALEDDIAGLTLIEPKGDKMQRAMLTVPYHEAHNLYLPVSAPWVDEFINECSKFPNGKHDDQLDAFTQGVIELHSGGLAYLMAMAGMRTMA